MDLINPLPSCFDTDKKPVSKSSSASDNAPKGRKRDRLKQIFRKSTSTDNGENTADFNNTGKNSSLYESNRVIFNAEVTSVTPHSRQNCNMNTVRADPQDYRNQNYQSINIHEQNMGNRQDLITDFTYQGLYNEQGLPDDRDGLMIWRNGDSYQGSFWNGMRDGMGTMTYANGSEYVGTWECNKMHGEGTRRFPNGNVYFGSYNQGKRQGKNGQFLFLNGDVYTGDFENDHFHGKGVYKHKGGVIFEGSFVHSKRQGLGVCKYLNKNTDTSWYENDKAVGKGVRCNGNQDTAWKLLNGHVVNTISFEEAFEVLEALHRRERSRTQIR